MDSFSEFVKHRAEAKGLSISALQDMLGWPYHKARSIVTGRLNPKQISFQDAADLALILDVSILDLADAGRV